MDKRTQTCCFTGHRHLPAGEEEAIWQRVQEHLIPLLEQGVRYFGVGGALGFDTLVAEKLLDLRRQYPQIRVILVLPFRGYQSRWTAAQQARAARIESRVDKVVYCCDAPSREAFLARDRHLVDGSACLLCPTRTPPVFVRRPADNMSLIWKSNKLFAAKGTCYDKQVPFAFPY